MSVRPAGRLLAIVALVLAIANACGPVADPLPPPTGVEPNPPSAQADSGWVADAPPPPATTESVLPSSEANSVPVDDPSPPTTTDSTEAPPAPRSVDVGDPGALSADARSLIDSWCSAVSASSSVWPGFDLSSIPIVLAAIDDTGTVEAAVAFNHPNPQALGTPARTLDGDGHRIVVLGEVADPNWLAARAPFDFFADVDGTDTFVLISQEGDVGSEPNTPEFIAMLVHEAFHRYQSDEWATSATRQYIDRYDFSAANLELALLENRVLIAAYKADDPGDLERLARQFAAIRATRRQRDYRVAHDEAQERTEGSAQFIEHRIGDSIGNVSYTATNHTRDLEFYDEILSNPEALADNITWYEVSIKRYFGFLRFYSSGATLLVLLERLGASDIARQLQDGRTPAGLLERHIAPLGDLDELVADGRAEHDPDNRLAAAAAILSELAIDEPATGLGHDGEFVLTDAQIACLESFGIEFSDRPVFGDRIGIPPNAGHSCLLDADFGLTDAQIACLEAFGIEFSDTPAIGDPVGIPQNVAGECLFEAADSDGAPG